MIAIKCSHCGSEDVRRDADAAWNKETQQWELVAVYDNATCEECGGETSLVEENIEEIITEMGTILLESGKPMVVTSRGDFWIDTLDVAYRRLDTKPKDGDQVKVRYHPDDQFAHML